MRDKNAYFSVRRCNAFMRPTQTWSEICVGKSVALSQNSIAWIPIEITFLLSMPNYRKHDNTFEFSQVKSSHFNTNPHLITYLPTQISQQVTQIWTLNQATFIWAKWLLCAFLHYLQ